MHRSAIALTALVAGIVAASPVAASPGAASPGTPAQATAVAGPIVDFDGDGQADRAVGAPGEDVGAVVDAGAVSVSGAGGHVFTQNSAAANGTAEPYDHFGAAIAAGDFNGDGFSDLAVSAPTEDVGQVVDAGAVNILYGSAGGLTNAGGQVFTQNSAGVPSSAERGDLFGVALTAADFDHDGRADLAIGVRREDGAAVDAGAVNVLYGSPAGLSGVGSQLFTQNSAGTGNHAESGDLFGSALAAGDFDSDGFADLAVGVPHEDVFAVKDAGAINVLNGSADGLTGTGGQLFTEDSRGVAGTAEAGDAFGTVLVTNQAGGDLAVGVPSEDVGAATDAGAVYLLPGSTGGLTGTGSELFSQNSHPYDGKAEAGDHFGFALAVVDFFGVGDSTLVVGVPGEDVGSAVDTGAVQIDRGLYTESNTPGGGSSRSGERLGTSLADGGTQPGSVVIGAPGENHGAGAVFVVTGVLDDGDQLPPSGHLDDQGAGAAEPGDFFGAALAGS